MQKAFAETWRSLDSSSGTSIHILPSVEDALEFVRGLYSENKDTGRAQAVHAFITGSVHLVGRALGVLEGAELL